MTLSEYTRLKNHIVLSVGKSESHTYLINKLKEFYSDDIDSDRRFEQINSIGELLNILEIRDVVSEDGVGPFKEIARRLNDMELLEKICEYERNYVPREFTKYSAGNSPNSIRSEPNKKVDNITDNFFSNLSETKKRRITDTLIEEIGTFWRDLARNLKIGEGKIDDIDSKYQTLDEKANALLILYFSSKADLQNWFYVLCDALVQSHRKDLSRSLQEIMTMNI